MSKPIAVLLSCLLLVACESRKGFDATNAALESDCPGQTNCEIKILPGKSMLVTRSENSTTYTLEDAVDKNVVVYKHSKIVKGGIQDAGYREEIVFEMDKNISVANLENDQLQDVKMLFGRFCYCKGQTGYYPIKKGKLSVDANHKGKLSFTVSEVPQVTKQIRFSLK